MSVSTNIDINALSDVKLALITCSNCGDVLDEVCVDTKFEVETGTKELNSGAGLNSDSESSLECCRSRLAGDW